jgi:peptidoglycan/LPS O-acetylase OafA/YrhL
MLFYVNFYLIHNGVAFTSALLILWSISIEEQFYFVWGPLLKFTSKKWIKPVIFVLSIISISFSWQYLYIQHNPANHLAIHSIFVLQNFCAGAFLAIVCVNKDVLFSYLTTTSRLFWLLIYTALPVCSFFINEIIVLNIIKSICYSLIIYDQAFNDNRIFNAGKIKIINYLGKISYGLYVYHALVIIVVQNSLHFLIPVGEYRFFAVALTFLITCMVAHLSYKFIEVKFLSLKSGFPIQQKTIESK